MATFVIHDDEYESGYLEGVQENLAITSQAGFKGIRVTSEAVKGDFEKETIFTGDVTFNNRDPSGTANRAESRLGLDENVGVKVSYNTDKMIIPTSDLSRSNFDRMAYSNAMGKNVAQNELKHVLGLAIAAAVTAIDTTASNSLAQTASFDKKDFVAALRPLQDQAINVVGWLASTGLAFDVLAESIDSNRYGESGVVYGASVGTLDRPMLSSALPELMDGTKQIMLALFEDAIEIKLNSSAPDVIMLPNHDTENHYYEWSLDGTFNLKLRNTPYTGVGGNVTKALLTTPANWGKTGSDTNLLGTLTRFGA